MSTAELNSTTLRVKPSMGYIHGNGNQWSKQRTKCFKGTLHEVTWA